MLSILLDILSHPTSNVVDEYDGYYVSYTNDAYGCESGDGETSLVTHDKPGSLSGNRYRILNGDWRLAYKEAGSLEACIELFEAKKAQFKSQWSD